MRRTSCFFLFCSLVLFGGVAILTQAQSDIDTTAPDAVSTTTMAFTPQSFNLNSQGKYVTVHLFLPSPHKAFDVNTSTVKLNDSLSPTVYGINYFKKEDKHKERNTSNLVLKFARSEFAALASSTVGDFEVTITGEVNEESFSASDTVNILELVVHEEEDLVTSTSSPEVYVIKNGHRRHIPTPQAFHRRGLAWRNIKQIPQEELDSYPDDELIRSSDASAVYLICAGMKRHIPSAEVFESYGFDWDDISVVSRDELTDYPDVNLIRGAGEAKVYLLAGGKRHWIPTVAVFNKHGYKWDNVIIVNSSEDAAIPEGENVE